MKRSIAMLFIILIVFTTVNVFAVADNTLASDYQLTFDDAHQHTSYYYRCILGVESLMTREHAFEFGGYEKLCHYYEVSAPCHRVCVACETVIGTAYHRHGTMGHTPIFCGESDTYECYLPVK